MEDERAQNLEFRQNNFNEKYKLGNEKMVTKTSLTSLQKYTYMQSAIGKKMNQI